MLAVLISALVGILASSVLAAEAVVFDGKRLIFPEKTIEPADISGLKFDLQLPENKRFVEGKVYRAQFVYPRGFNLGPLRYLIFTKWTAKEIEIFWWPITISQPFLDCSMSHDNDSEFKCLIRGEGRKFKLFLLFRLENGKITILPDDGAVAYLEPTGEIPVHFMKERSNR
jgi:hypothetical protein